MKEEDGHYVLDISESGAVGAIALTMEENVQVELRSISLF